jgi:hypothetical protein
MLTLEADLATDSYPRKWAYRPWSTMPIAPSRWKSAASYLQNVLDDGGETTFED